MRYGRVNINFWHVIFKFKRPVNQTYKRQKYENRTNLIPKARALSDIFLISNFKEFVDDFTDGTVIA